MLKLFRATSLLEGISYLVILSVTLGFISREFVYPLGMLHGALFALYFVLSLIASHRQGWSVLVWLMVLLAAIIPFAFLAVDVFLRKELNKPSPG
ncbi:MAG: DUF3817 domain-containing protein [Halioglobus sp.]